MKTLFLLISSITAFICNAQTWSPVSTGMNDYILALAVYNGNLYAGGRFTTAGGNSASYIAEWNGTSWSAVGGGMNNVVMALTVCNGNLYAGGGFTVAGGNSANYIAVWNGTIWSALGSGMYDNSGFCWVSALAGNNGNIYAGGQFTLAGGTSTTNIAEWNGSTWSALSSGINYPVSSLTTYSGNVYAGGNFTSAGGNSANNIAEWNGTAWSAVGSGVYNGNSGPGVTALTTYSSSLIAGGDFDSAGGVFAPNIAEWYSPSWSSIYSTFPGANNTVEALVVYNGNLYLGGDFTSILYWGPTNYIAEWNGLSWSALGTGMDNVVYALTPYNGSLYAAGNFTTAAGNSANYIARWGAVTGINNVIEDNSINIIPNPNNGKFTIQLSDISGESLIEVYNVLGERVLTEAIQPMPKGALNEINMSSQPNGVYLYKVIAKDGNLVGEGKFIIQK